LTKNPVDVILIEKKTRGGVAKIIYDGTANHLPLTAAK